MNVATVSTAIPTVVRPPLDVSGSEERISIKDLNFYYGDHKALKDIQLPLYKNKVTAFIGPSGCGKSTLLRILNRMYDLYPNQRADGHVMLDGKDILSPKQDLNLLRARIGMVFQKPTPFPMSIYENIAFGIRLYEKLSKARTRWPRRERAAPRRLVGRGEGQAERQRPEPVGRPAAAALYRAHGGGAPEVILFDEPCSALDPISTAKIEELIDELEAEYTIVIVTHNMQQAARVSRLYRVHVSRRVDRVRHHDADVHRPA